MIAAKLRPPIISGEMADWSPVQDYMRLKSYLAIPSLCRKEGCERYVNRLNQRYSSLTPHR